MPMDSWSKSVVDQATSVMVCLCGATVDRHQGKDHPFVEAHGPWQPSTWRRGARYEHEGLNPATPLYITVEDRCRISVLSQITAEVDFTARLQRPDGEVIPIRMQQQVVASAALQNLDLDLTEGFLLDCSLTTPTAGARVGLVFAVAQIIRGSGVNALPSRTLVANYVSIGNVLGWPEGPNQQSIQNAGLPIRNTAVNPAAGADITFVVPTGVRWWMQSFSAQLVTSATVANRTPHVQIVDAGGNVMWDCAASAAQAASLTLRYSVCGGVQPAVADNSAIIPIPDSGFMFAGWSLKTVTTNLQATDQWQNLNGNTLQWIEL